MTEEKKNQPTEIKFKDDMHRLRYKLSLIMKETDKLKKDGYNKAFNFAYTTEETIKTELKKKFVEHGLLLKIDTSNERVVDKVLFFDAHYSFVDIETGAEWKGTTLGAGHIRDDKGYWAGLTGVIKYILTTEFFIPTGDDTERDDRQVKNQTQTKPGATKPPVKSQNTTYKSSGDSRTPTAPQNQSSGKPEHATESQVKFLLDLAFKRNIESRAKYLVGMFKVPGATDLNLKHESTGGIDAEKWGKFRQRFADVKLWSNVKHEDASKLISAWQGIEDKMKAERKGK